MHNERSQPHPSVLDDQRLVSIDTLLSVGDGLAKKRRRKHPEEYVVLLAAQTREFEVPRPIFSNGERTQWAAGIYNNHHTDVEMRTDLPKLLKAPTASRVQVERGPGPTRVFGTLSWPQLRVLLSPRPHKPCTIMPFVRSHDFAGESMEQEPLAGACSSRTGFSGRRRRALRRLPRRPSHALAELEQGFRAQQRSGAHLG